MNALRKATARLLWPSIVVGLVTLLAGVALLVLGQFVAAAAVGAVCGLCALEILAADAQASGPAATSPARTRYLPLP